MIHHKKLLMSGNYFQKYGRFTMISFILIRNVCLTNDKQADSKIQSVFFIQKQFIYILQNQKFQNKKIFLYKLTFVFGSRPNPMNESSSFILTEILERIIQIYTNSLQKKLVRYFFSKFLEKIHSLCTYLDDLALLH